MTVEEAIALIDATSALVPRITQAVQSASAGWSETDKARLDARLAAQQAQTESDYLAARASLQAASAR